MRARAVACTWPREWGACVWRGACGGAGKEPVARGATPNSRRARPSRPHTRCTLPLAPVPSHRLQRLRKSCALGSARETLACLEVAVVSHYVPKDAQLHDQLDRVVGTLVKLTRV